MRLLVQRFPFQVLEQAPGSRLALTALFLGPIYNQSGGGIRNEIRHRMSFQFSIFHHALCCFVLL